MKKFIFAFLVGVICGIPYILPIFHVTYKGIPFLYQDNEDIYLSRIQEVAEGNYSIASPVFYEYKDSINAQQPMGEWIYGFVGKIVPLTYLVIITKFFFPALLFLLIFNLVFRLSNHEYAALFASTAGILGFDMVRISFLKEIVTGTVGFHLSIWTRLVNPITGALFLFLFLNILLTVYQQKRWKHVVFAGVVLGCMTGYYFSFIVACTIAALVGIYALYKKEYLLLKKIVCIFGIGFLVNIHYAWSLLYIHGEDALKSGMILTHVPLVNKLQIMVVLLLAVTYTKLKKTNIWMYAALLTITSVLAMNIHVITGRAIWPQHFVQYTNLFGIISVTLLLSNWFKKTFLYGTLLIFILAIFIIPSYKEKIEDFQDKQRLAPAFAWLNTTVGDCVVLAYEKTAKIAWTIPAYTKCDSYTSPYVFSAVPYERILHNFLVILRIRGGQFNQDDLREYFFRDWRDMFAHQPDAWLASITDTTEMNIYYSNLEKEIKKQYQIFNFDKKYKLEYIIWDSKNASSTSPKKEKGIRQVFNENDIVIFTYDPKND